jgi:hypothetical protein
MIVKALGCLLNICLTMEHNRYQVCSKVMISIEVSARSIYKTLDLQQIDQKLQTMMNFMSDFLTSFTVNVSSS